MNRNELINKLRRLAAESPNEGERKAALFGLERLGAEMGPADQQASIDATFIGNEEGCLASGCCRLFGVELLRRRCRGARGKPGRWRNILVFTGEAGAARAAAALFEELRDQLRKTLTATASGFVWGVFPPTKAPPSSSGAAVREVDVAELEALQFGAQAGRRLRPAKLLPMEKSE